MIVLLVNAAATLFMTGLIWFVQVVHYPLAGAVGAAQFPAYQATHMRLTGPVVGPPMLLELATTALLVAARPEPIPAWLAWTGAALLAAVWGSTALLQVPAHEALLQGLDPAVVRRLVATNWIRTVAWTGRAAVVLAMLSMVLRR